MRNAMRARRSPWMEPLGVLGKTAVGAAALAAVEADDALRVAGLTMALGDYPLVDYLHYRWLRARLRRGEQLDGPVREYLTYYPGKYAERLRAAWVARRRRSSGP